jgi:hypothetical protein
VLDWSVIRASTELMGSVSTLEKKTARQPELQVQEQVARVEKQIEAQTQQTAVLETQMQGKRHPSNHHHPVCFVVYFRCLFSIVTWRVIRRICSHLICRRLIDSLKNHTHTHTHTHTLSLSLSLPLSLCSLCSRTFEIGFVGASRTRFRSPARC